MLNQNRIIRPLSTLALVKLLVDLFFEIFESYIAFMFDGKLLEVCRRRIVF